MEGFAIFKSQKLLKVHVQHDGIRVQAVKIHGDFFLYPEDAISKLESALENVPLEKSALESAISISLSAANAEAFGFNAPDLAQAILQAANPPVASSVSIDSTSGAKSA